MGMCESVPNSRESAWLAISKRIANPPHRCTVPTTRRKRLWHGDSHNIKKACESLSDSRESAWLANPGELRIRIIVKVSHPGVMQLHAVRTCTSLSFCVVPLDCAIHVVPPSCVWIIWPSVPTTHPTLLWAKLQFATGSIPTPRD